jgi:hypothetical protein
VPGLAVIEAVVQRDNDQERCENQNDCRLHPVTNMCTARAKLGRFWQLYLL